MYALYSSVPHGHLTNTVSVLGVQLARAQCQGWLETGVWGNFPQNWSIPIAGVLAYDLSGMGSLSRSKLSPIAQKAVTHST